MGTRGLVDDLDADALANQLDGTDPVESEPLAHEREDVATFMAHEAVIRALVRRDREVGFGALMERTRPAITPARALERHILTDDLHSVRRVPHPLDDVVRNHRQLSSATVTPSPPSFHAPSRNPATRVSFFSISLTRERNAPVPLP